MSAETVIKRCKAQFARHGQPERVITDNGPQFTSQFTRFASEWEFEHVTSSPRHPKANGKAESAVKIAKNLLRKAAHDGDDPESHTALEKYSHRKYGQQPAQRLMSRRLKTSIPANKLLEPVVVVGVTEKLRHRKQLAKSFYDRSARDLPELEVGETVRMKPLPGDNTGRWRESGPAFAGLHRDLIWWMSMAPCTDVTGLTSEWPNQLREPRTKRRGLRQHMLQRRPLLQRLPWGSPTVTEPSPVRSTPKALSSPVGAPPSDGHTYTRLDGCLNHL
ncbi:hypothetical protein AAFF_G00237730 [Aldrovandia affinis]|uniref:Integrase catalytic domain-containing protein n=1 Tax=Aldrovandia affinis TaxID=143900 RepID=A0AAD7W3A7_9TELE|nr:hypothetical protein AAFF_G00237730 [Aldrovandia affinis]